MFGEDWSESPRLPSPWETAAASSYTSDRSAGGGSPGPRCLIPEEDLSGHIEYKLRLPAFPSIDRLARLTSQLKWRLLEGGGEAIYEIGVCDNGLLLGIDRQEMDASLKTLERMASGLGATVRVIREVQVDATGLAEDVKAAASSRFYKTQPTVSPPLPPTILKASTVGTYQKKGMNPTKLFVHKQALSKEAKRTARRDKIFSERKGYTYVERNKDASDTTPPLEEVPSLSHSPSPPRPSSRQVRNVETITSSNGTSTVSSSVATLASSTDSVAPPLSAEQIAEEEKRRTIRRHLQKQWKKDRHRAKVEERRLAAGGSPTVSALHLLATTPEDRFMDGLVGLFDGVELDEIKEVPAISKKKQKWSYRRAREGEIEVKRDDEVIAATEMDGSTDLSLLSPTMIHDQQRRRLAFAVPLALAEGDETRRFAMECIVSYPEEEEDADEEEEESQRSEATDIGQLEEDEGNGEDDDEDSLFPTIPPPRKQRVRLRSNNSFRKPSYIDFQNPNLILP